MSFKFMHSKIDTRSSVPSLSDIVKLAQTKKALGGQVKTASAQVPTKVAKKKEAEEEVESEETEEKEDGDEKEENVAFPGAAPKFKKKESKASTKVAEKDKEEGKSSGQPEAEAKLVNEPKKPEGAKGTGGGKKKGEGDEGKSSGQLDVEPLHQLGESTGEKPGDLETQKGEKKSEKKESSARFVRVAELTDKQKSFLRATWSLYWPKSFIDALLAAK